MVFTLFSLAGCSSDSSSSTPSSSPPPASSSSAPSSTSVPPSSQSTPSSAPTGGHDVAQLASTLAEAAGLGSTIPVRQLDLELAGMNAENFAAFAGAEAQTSAQNGGIVVVIQAQPGTADAVAQELAAFRDSRMGNEDYAEFEDARANTENARIQVHGDYVVYAVSAIGQQDGGWAQLDEAITAAFA